MPFRDWNLTFHFSRCLSIGEKVEYSFWEKYDGRHTVIRLATDWGTTEAETNALIEALKR